MPGFSIVATLVMGLGALVLREIRTSTVGVGAAVGVVLTAVGAVADFGWLAGVGVLAAAVALGVLVGRLVPPSALPMAVVLGALSVADIVWVTSGGGLSADWANQVLNFSVDFGGRSSSIGTLDLVLSAALASHWLERRAGAVLSLAAAPLGMVVANIYVALSGADNLPLVPFITLGWLVTEATNRFSQNRRRTQRLP